MSFMKPLPEEVISNYDKKRRALRSFFIIVILSFILGVLIYAQSVNRFTFHVSETEENVDDMDYDDSRVLDYYNDNKFGEE